MHPGGEITHVSDTALMVAACRALETALDDGFIRDPFAARLAGERGLAILRALPHAMVAQMGLSIRARFVDELLLEALAQHRLQTVVSLGCGLDTRPWRLDLDPRLRWLEVDFADVLDYKDRLLSGETPRCRRERLAVDLNDAAQRRALYSELGDAPALMITEGLLLYLPAATVEALARESGEPGRLTHWISDITTSTFSLSMGGPDSLKSIRHVQATDALKGEQILDLLERHRWARAAFRSYVHDVGFTLPRLRRMMGGAEPPPLPVPQGDPTGVHCFSRL